jgi:hypothetical protein
VHEGEAAPGTSAQGPSMLVACSSIPSVQCSVTLPPDCVIVTTPKVGRRTVTVNVQVLVLPQPSLAVQRTVFVELGRNEVPDGGVEVTVTTLHVSVATKVHVTIKFVSQVVKTMLLGQIVVGIMPSTVTV